MSSRWWRSIVAMILVVLVSQGLHLFVKIPNVLYAEVRGSAKIEQVGIISMGEWHQDE